MRPSRVGRTPYRPCQTCCCFLPQRPREAETRWTAVVSTHPAAALERRARCAFASGALPGDTEGPCGPGSAPAGTHAPTTAADNRRRPTFADAVRGEAP